MSAGPRAKERERKTTTLKAILFRKKCDFRAFAVNAERLKRRQRTNGFGAAADLFPENSRDLSNERPQVTLKGLQVAASAGNPGGFVFDLLQVITVGTSLVTAVSMVFVRKRTKCLQRIR